MTHLDFNTARNRVTKYKQNSDDSFEKIAE